MMILDFEGIRPRQGQDVLVAPTVTVIGDVDLGDEANIWYGSVLRGDVGRIHIGKRTNIQDLTVIHVTTQTFDTYIGDEVTVGHRVILHGCHIEDRVLVGMGSTVMDGAKIGPYNIIGAGALVTPGSEFPGGQLLLGSPARAVRDVKDTERQFIEASAAHYVELAKRHAQSNLGQSAT
ncbi:MAG: gamma carbonic anhydrase family protein [Myxococcota bacterium]